jgi:LacI family transcriptional regulator
MGRRPTISDIAAAAGVSVATVSKAVNGRYGVSRDTSEHVLRVVADMGYESSLGASGMRGTKTGVIGVLVAEIESFAAEVLKGIGAAAQSSGFDLLVYTVAFSHEPKGWENRSLRRLSGSLIDAAIMVTPTVVAAPTEIPLVAIDPHVSTGEISTVEADSLNGAYGAVAYLISLGHRRIGFVAGRPDLRSSRARDSGYRRALAEAGIQYDPALVRVGFYDEETTRAAGSSLLGSESRPTAVFAANDASAIGIVKVARGLGIDVPGDLSVIGFDDVVEASRLVPPLTTVRQPMRLIGQTATEVILARLAGGDATVRHVELPTELVVRATTAPPRRR